LDGATGCLALFACQVARHGRAKDAEEALRCLRAARSVEWQALRRHPVHFLWHSLDPYLLYLRFVRVPLARWRLWRLAARARGRRPDGSGGDRCASLSV
jgi:hypothetical protein